MKKSKHLEILSTVICGLLKPGDEVVCVDARGMDLHMSAGDRFVVQRSKASDKHIRVKNDNFDGLLLAYRFRPVPKSWADETFNGIKQVLDSFFIVEDPEIPWATLPDWVQWVAKDLSGDVWGYERMPTISPKHSVWQTIGRYVSAEMTIPGHWKDSLRQRPTGSLTQSDVDELIDAVAHDKAIEDRDDWNASMEKKVSEMNVRQRKASDELHKTIREVAEGTLPRFQPDELILVRDSILDGWMTGRFVKMDGDKFIARHARPKPVGAAWDGFWETPWRMAIKFDPEKAESV